MRKTLEKKIRCEILDSLAQNVEMRIEDQRASIERWGNQLCENPDDQYLNDWIQEAKETMQIYRDVLDYLARG